MQGIGVLNQYSCYINIDPKDCIDAMDNAFGNKDKKLERNDVSEFVEMFKAWKNISN